jgi:hypothetical protein
MSFSCERNARFFRRGRRTRGFGLWAAVLATASAARAGTAELTLSAPSTTSAGVYASDGRLVRTLWSGRRLDAGAVAVAWDGRDDDGAPVPPGVYAARVLAHNVRYVWEGVVGNTSRDKTGASVYRAYQPINDMAFDESGRGFYVIGYDEGQPGPHRFETKDPQRQAPLLRPDYRRVFRYAAADNSVAYFANIGLAAERGAFNRVPETFVVAVDVTSGEAHRFATGVAVDAWPNVIDYDRDDRDSHGEFRSAPTGIAVQRRGDLLFVAHGQLDEIRIFDKRTGERVGRIPAGGARDLDVAPDDSLWAIGRADGRATAVHYRPVGGEWREAGRIDADLENPVAIAVSPLDGTIVVADAGTDQLRAFDSDGRAAWTLGQRGGYRSNGPAVTADKLWLAAGPTYVAFEPDGTFWLGDPGNVRNLHYSRERRLLGEIMYLNHSYVVAVDSSDPTRVFRHFLEFKVDYSAPIESSWKLVANWGGALDPRRYAGSFDGLQAVHTLRNGRTYGVVRRYDLGINEVVELTPAGLRATGEKLEIGTKLYADGSERWHAPRFGGLKVFERSLRGFDDAGNPTWDAPRALGGIAHLRDTDPYPHDVPLVGGVNEATYPITASGVLVSFNPGTAQGFHLGGIKLGEDRWLWRASPSGNWDVDDAGNIRVKDGRYEIGNGVQYLGNVVVTAGRNVIYGYHGEAWRGGQANQWLHFYDNGLFIGQFGRPGVPGKTDPTPAAAEQAGNTFSPQLVTVDGQVYLWHNDEHGHGGIHRWRIDGLDQIRLLEAPIEP